MNSELAFEIARLGYSAEKNEFSDLLATVITQQNALRYGERLRHKRTTTSNNTNHRDDTRRAPSGQFGSNWNVPGQTMNQRTGYNTQTNPNVAP
jgi:hypothetical protein